MRIRVLLSAAIVSCLTIVIGACHPAGPPPAQEGRVVLADGDSLSYRVVGMGSDTVLVVPAGPAFGSRYLEPALAALTRSHVLVFYDPRGRGRSSVARQLDSFSLARDAHDLGALHDSLRLGVTALIGHQWGTAVALHYALAHPAQVRRLVLLAPMAHKQAFVTELSLLPNDTAALARHAAARAAQRDTLDPTGYCREFWGFAFSPVEETDPAVVQSLAPDVCADPPPRLRQREVIQRQFYLGMPGWDWSDSIAAVTQPSFVLVGDAVPALVAGAEAWAGRLPDGRLMVTAGSALFPWVTSRRTVEQALADFLAGQWPSSARKIGRPPDAARVTQP